MRRRKNDFTNRNNNWSSFRIAYLLSRLLLEQGERRMTKEELKKEADGKYIKKSKRLAYEWSGAVYKEGYKDGAEPREKRIAELEDKLANADYQLEGRDNEIAKLEAQIEKMKCCENCAWWYKLPNGQRDCAETCENRDNWSLRR